MSESTSFSDLKISKDLLEVISELGFQNMTPIQAQSIPVMLKGKDLIGQSKTGSGKTAAFAIPILQNISVSKRKIQAIILCPTRELCAQVAREIRRLARRHKGLQVLVLSGGQFIAPQLSALEKGAHIAVGTPGRVLDIMSRGKLDLNAVKTLVLDEADRMLDMGFEEDMNHILSQMPEKRQTVLFSATFPDSIMHLSKEYQKDPTVITVQSDNEQTPAIMQFFIQIQHEERMQTLVKVLRKVKPDSAIVFCNLKAMTREVAEYLQSEGFRSESLSGDLEQYERDKVMAKFRNQSTKILVATDVAARGIDVEKLDIVINYDTPAKPDVYVHRIGRTGRAGKSGIAVSLLAQKERHKLDYISEYTKNKHKFSYLEDIQTESLPDQDSVPVQVTNTQNMKTICIHAGRKDKLRPGDVLGALTGEAGKLSGSQVGKIEIHDRLTYVAVAESIAERACTALAQGKIKGRTFKISIVN